MRGTAALLDVFLDFGDLFSPKKLLYAGKWMVVSSQYRTLNGRQVYLFTLKAHAKEIVEFLRFTFFDAQHPRFEKALRKFSSARHAIYRDFPDVLRAKDNVAGEIGEYFAIKALNEREKHSVIRLSSGIKDIDAIQTRNGVTYAIKTIGRIPQKTSNIWAKKPEKSVGYFVIVLLKHESLVPDCVFQLSARRAARFLKLDKYQGAWKLHVDASFLRQSKLLQGKRPFALGG